MRYRQNRFIERVCDCATKSCVLYRYPTTEKSIRNSRLTSNWEYTASQKVQRAGAEQNMVV
jgi:hypothetical protein